MQTKVVMVWLGEPGSDDTEVKIPAHSCILAERH